MSSTLILLMISPLPALPPTTPGADSSALIVIGYLPALGENIVGAVNPQTSVNQHILQHDGFLQRRQPMLSGRSVLFLNSSQIPEVDMVSKNNTLPEEITSLAANNTGVENIYHALDHHLDKPVENIAAVAYTHAISGKPASSSENSMNAAGVLLVCLSVIAAMVYVFRQQVRQKTTQLLQPLFQAQRRSARSRQRSRSRDQRTQDT